jgi:hypothetical protein
MWWARGELNHSTAASDLGRYAKSQVNGAVTHDPGLLRAVACCAVMPRGITTDLDVVEGDVRKPGQARQLPGRG